MTYLSKTDLSTSSKVDLAVLSLAARGEYGSISSLAEGFEVSRPTVYAAARTAEELLTEHFADSEFGNKVLSVPVDSAQLRRAVTALRAQAPNSIRDIEGLLPVLYPGLSVSYGVIQGICAEAETKAKDFNAKADLSRIRAGALDEMFSQGRPVLGGVDLDSGYLFLLALRGGRSGDDWAEELRVCRTRGMVLDKAVKDAGLGIQAGVESVYPEAEQRDDCFHALYALGRAASRLERRAYAAMGEVEEIRAKIEKCRRTGRGNRQRLYGRLSSANRKVNRTIEEHDRFEQAQRQVQEALEPVDRRSGELRSAEVMKSQIIAGAEEMLSMKDKKSREAGRYLKNRAEGLTLHVREFSASLEQVSSVFGRSPVVLSCLVLQLLTELRGGRHSYRRFESRRQLRRAYQELQHVAGDRCGQVLVEVEFLLWQRHRASSAIEGFNAALRPYLYVHKGVTAGFLELFRAYYNLRIRRWGRHKGTSPQQVLTGEPTADWLTLLGCPPSSLLN